MSITLIVVLILLGLVWLIGGIVAIILMFWANVLVLDEDLKHESYTRKEFVIGFLASWITVRLVSQTLIDNL